MKKCLLFLTVFFFEISFGYALSFDVNLSSDKSSLKSGESTKIYFNIVNIEDTDAGISSCMFNISADSGIEISNNINVFDSWKYEKGNKGYAFDTTSSVKSNYKLFELSATINNGGNITFSDITCYDADDNEKNIGNKVIKLEVISNSGDNSKSSNSNQSNSSSSSSSSSSLKSKSSKSSSSLPNSSYSTSNESSLKSSSSVIGSSSSYNLGDNSSSSNLSNNVYNEYVLDFQLVGGELDFNRNKYNYKIYVDDLDALEIEPVVAENCIYDVEKLEGINEIRYIFSVYDSVDNVKTYTIVASLIGDKNVSTGTDYTYIFVIIIVLLLGINIFRIIKKKKL